MKAIVRPAAGGRVAALLAVALIIVAPAVWIAWSLHAAALLADTNRAQAAMLANLQSRIAGIEPEEAGTAEADSASIFLPGETPAIAGAALQRTIADTIRAAGGTLIEAEFARVEASDEDPGRVDLRISFDAEINSLQQVLLQLESGLPILLVRSVDVQSATEATEAMSPPLRVAMLVGGYWEAAE